MDTKKTRRLVLISIVSGLVAGPMIIQRFFKNQSADLSYTFFNAMEAGYNADIPPDEVQNAFDLLLKERNAWHTFRKLNGKVRFTHGEKSKITESCLSLELIPSKKENSFPFPYGYKLISKDSDCKEILGIYNIDRNTNTEHYEGNIAKELIQQYCSLLTAPIELFYTLTNDRINEYFGSCYKVSANPFALNEANSYAFTSMGTKTDGILFYTKEGKLCTIISPVQPSGYRNQWNALEWKIFGNLFFPTKIEFTKVSSNTLETIESLGTLEFSEIQVEVASNEV